MLAVELGRVEIAEKLLELGASAAFKNKVHALLQVDWWSYSV
jgi:hypothetical protein